MAGIPELVLARAERSPLARVKHTWTRRQPCAVGRRGCCCWSPGLGSDLHLDARNHAGLEADLARIGTTSVVAFLVSSRFALATAVLPFFASVRKLETRGLESRPCPEPCLVGRLLGSMTALGELEPSTSAFLTSLYVVSTALLSNLFGEGRPSSCSGSVCCWPPSAPVSSKAHPI